MPDVSIVIATNNMGHLISQTIKSIIAQTGVSKEIIVFDDHSQDGTGQNDEWWLKHPDIRYVRGATNVGVGNAFNHALQMATADVVISMCSDDVLISRHVLADIKNVFDSEPEVGHVSRWYYQFIDPDLWTPVRAWRTHDPVIQANNPSGLAFRREALKHAFFSNKMFIESSHCVWQVLQDKWEYRILNWDTVAVRVHASTSTQPGYYLKRRVSSPVMDWMDLGAKDIAKDYVSFIQIKNGFTTSAVVEEIINFAKVRPLNLVHPLYWFYAILAVVTPRRILRKLPHLYRKYIGRKITRVVKRPTNTGGHHA